MKGIIYLHIHLKEATIANCEIESLQNHRLLTNTTSIAKIQCYVCWLWNATTIVLRHSQTKWQRTTRTPNLFTSLVFSTHDHLLLPRARPRAIKGLLKCGLKGLLKCGIKAWDRSQLNPTCACTCRISLLSTPRPRLRLGLGLITTISYSWWGLTIT